LLRDTTPTGNPFHEHVHPKDTEWTTIQRRNPLPNLQRVTAKQINSIPTVGNTYADKIHKKANPTTPRPTTTPPSTVRAYTEAQLRSTRTTKATIINNAKQVFNVTLSTTTTKPILIQNYLNLVGMTNPAPSTTTSTSTPPDNNRRPRQKRISSDWNIRRLQGTGLVEFRKPFGGNTYTMIKAIESSLRQHMGEPEPPITILSGRWWSPLSSNFTLTIAG
jgi:hypothetical protein